MKILAITQFNYICHVEKKKPYKKKVKRAVSYEKQQKALLDYSRVSLHTRRLIRDSGYHIQYIRLKDKKLKYHGRVGKSRPIAVTLDFDALQYLGVVRYYIQTKYDIKINDLELLLYLYPIAIWSKADYDSFPHRYTTRNIESLIDRGWVEDIFGRQIPSHSKKTYRLTLTGKSIVRKFYAHLTEKEPIPEESRYNPLFGKNATPRQMKVAKAVAKMNQDITGIKTEAHKSLDKRMKERRKSPESLESREKFKSLYEKIKREKELEKIKQKLNEERNQ